MGNPYREHTPGPALARWIDCCWSVETAESLPGFPVRPDGCLDIIYSREGGLSAIRDGRAHHVLWHARDRSV